ncbi:MAG: hypothetical protein M9894_16025 [Planctomycetes bacterium]|nr:hypothetical protein [Planctomycetota bacterium]
MADPKQSSEPLALSDATIRDLERRAPGDPEAAAALERHQRRLRAGPVVGPADVFASRVTSALGAAWAAVRERHPELPPAVVVLASGTTSNVRCWGHWGASRWDVAGDRAGEVLIAGELLAPGGGNEPERPVEERVLGTLLHEAAHALAWVRGIKDTSRGGRYHNERYAHLAAELGLDVARDRVYGWTLTRLRDETVEAYREALADLREVLIGHRAPEAEAAGGAGGSAGGAAGGARAGAPTRIRAVCGCDRRVYVAPGVLELGPIVCGVCEEPFRAG